MPLITAYPQPVALPRSDSCQVRLDGVAVEVLRVPIHGGQAADLVIAAATGAVAVTVDCTGDTARATVRPSRLGIRAELAPGRIACTVLAPAHVVIQRPGQPQLFLLLAAEPAPPAADAIRFGPGIHEVGELEVPAGRELWLDGGAVLRGAVRARGPGCRVRGPGIIDGSLYDPKTARRRTLVLDRCHGGLVEGVTIINPSSWSCVLGACDGARVAGLRVFGDVVCSDGVDLVGCRDTVVEDCLLAVNDDCVAIKSFDVREHKASVRPESDADWARDCANLEIRRCVMLNGPAGNGVEIGGETACASIRGIRWRDIDLLCVHGHGAAFSIRVCDRATVSDILYEDIRVEHHWDRLMSLRVTRNSYTYDAERGQLRNVVFRRIRVARESCNAGHTIAIIGGHDPRHTVEGVHFEDFVLDGVHVLKPEQMDLFTRDASGITFA
jgi:hypothetical protein